MRLLPPVGRDGGEDQGARAEKWKARCHELRRALAQHSDAVAAGAAAKVRRPHGDKPCGNAQFWTPKQVQEMLTFTERLLQLLPVF